MHRPLIRCLSGISIIVLLPVTARAQLSDRSLSAAVRTDTVMDMLPEMNPQPVQAGPTINDFPHWYAFLGNAPGDYVRGADIMLDTKNLPALAGLGAVSFTLARTDFSTWRATRTFLRHTKFGRGFTDAAVELGDGKFHLGIMGLLAGYGWLTDSPRELSAASNTLEAFLVNGLAVQVLKHVTGRESPAAATRHTGRWKFLPHLRQYNKHQPSYYAFPSGHISTAMATLTVLADDYPEARWIRPVGYTCIGILGASLVAKGMHWYSDLPAGVALGYLFGRVIAHPMERETATGIKEGGLQVSLLPVYGQNGSIGLDLDVSF